jgi:ABC-type multidrug transport system fused ATPase/permease subunit
MKLKTITGRMLELDAFNSAKQIFTICNKHLNIKRKKSLIFLFILMLISTVSEMISLGLIFPFLGAMVSPEKMQLSFESFFGKSSSINSTQSLLIILAAIFLMAISLAASIKLLLMRAFSKLAFLMVSDFSNEIYARTIYQPYVKQINIDSSEIISAITVKTNALVYQGIIPILTILSSVLMSVGLISVLMLISPFATLLSILIFTGIYICIGRYTKKRLILNSEKISKYSSKSIKILREGLGGIRDVIIDSAQERYLNEFKHANKSWRSAQGDNLFISQSPRLAVETIAMALIASASCYLAISNGGITMFIPFLGAIAIASQKLLPAFQQIYSSLASIRGNEKSLQDIANFLKQEVERVNFSDCANYLFPSNGIHLRGVGFQHGLNKPIFENLDLKIPMGTRLAIVGETGAGKSTLLDVIMGLLPPTSGEIYIDDRLIDDRNRGIWMASIAHVPQSIFMIDDTIAKNIALSLSDDYYNINEIMGAARKAKIADDIEAMPNGYHTIIGERGIRLSGGQRQRIAIARALFKKAKIIILDEATSALDEATERVVMEAVNSLGSEVTVIIVSHKSSTLNYCELIYELKGGKLIQLNPDRVNSYSFLNTKV